MGLKAACPVESTLTWRRGSRIIGKTRVAAARGAYSRFTQARSSDNVLVMARALRTRSASIPPFGPVKLPYLTPVDFEILPPLRIGRKIASRFAVLASNPLPHGARNNREVVFQPVLTW